jgi:hypothetical protein
MKLRYYFRIPKVDLIKLKDYFITNTIEFYELQQTSFEDDYLFYAYLDDKDRTSLKLTFEIKNMLRL